MRKKEQFPAPLNLCAVPRDDILLTELVSAIIIWTYFKFKKINVCFCPTLQSARAWLLFQWLQSQVYKNGIPWDTICFVVPVSTTGNHNRMTHLQRIYYRQLKVTITLYCFPLSHKQFDPVYSAQLKERYSLKNTKKCQSMCYLSVGSTFIHTMLSKMFDGFSAEKNKSK